MLGASFADIENLRVYSSVLRWIILTCPGRVREKRGRVADAQLLEFANPIALP